MMMMMIYNVIFCFQEQHRVYSRKVEEVKAIQADCVNDINKQRKSLNKLAESIRRYSIQVFMLK